jgi:hypothetical protein
MSTETKEEAELIDAVEKKLAGPGLAEVMGQAIREDLERPGLARRIFKLTPIKE